MNDRRLQDGEILAMLHIPKTAGTSLISAINKSGERFAHILDPRYHNELRPELLTPRDHLISLGSEIASGRYRIVVGHMTRSDVIHSLGNASNIRYAAMIRDPVERVLSEYYYYTSDRHPDHAFMRQRYPSLETYSREGADTNLMCHYLESYRGQPLSELVRSIVEDFCFLGHSETYEQDARRLLGLFTDCSPTLERLNVGVARPAPSCDILRTIRRRNAKDLQLFNQLGSAYGWLD